MKEQMPWIMIVGVLSFGVGLWGGFFSGESYGKAEMRLTAQREAALAGVGRYQVGEKGEPVFALMECGKGAK